MQEFKLQLRRTPLTVRELHRPGEMHQTLERLCDGEFHRWARTGDLEVRLRVDREPTWTQLPDGYCRNVDPVTVRLPDAGEWVGFRWLAQPVKRSDDYPNGRSLRNPIEMAEWACERLESKGCCVQDIVAGRRRPYMQGRYKGITLDAVQFKGVVEVTDAALFRDAYRNGVGRQKSFGLGMMLIDSTKSLE